MHLLKINSSILFCFIFSLNIAQTKDHYTESFPIIGTPCFQETKILLIQKHARLDTSNKKNSPYSEVLFSKRQLAQLSIKEKLIYALEFPESYLQSCSFYIRQPDNAKRVYSELLFSGFGSIPSHAQLDALQPHKKEVSVFLSNCINTNNQIQKLTLDIIITLRLYQCIPTIINYYHNTKDKVALNFLIHYLSIPPYEPFANSKIYTALSFVPIRKGVILTKEFEQEILTHAQNYYQWKLEQQ